MNRRFASTVLLAALASLVGLAIANSEEDPRDGFAHHGYEWRRHPDLIDYLEYVVYDRRDRNNKFVALACIRVGPRVYEDQVAAIDKMIEFFGPYTFERCSLFEAMINVQMSPAATHEGIVLDHENEPRKVRVQCVCRGPGRGASVFEKTYV